MSGDHYKEDLYRLAEMILKKSKYGLYVCPFCGSGVRDGGTGALSIHRTTGVPGWICHSCNRSGDTLDLIGLYYGLDKRGQYKKAKELFGR